MSRYCVTGSVTITVTTVVDASSEEEARELASERGMSGSWRDDGNDKEEWVHDDLDGEPRIISVELAPTQVPR